VGHLPLILSLLYLLIFHGVGRTRHFSLSLQVDHISQAEDVKAEPGFGAGEETVEAGAQYGVPLGLTLAVLVFAGLLWFFGQLWVSERNLSKSSIPFSS